MSDAALKQAAAQMRATFDATFAEAAKDTHEAAEDLLAIRAGTRHVALRSREIAAIMRCPALTVVPGRNPALVGLAGLRGALVAVYSLAALLGDESRAGENRWLVVCGDDRSAALSFDELAGYERVVASAIHAAGTARDETEVVTIAGARRAVLSVPRLLNTIGRPALGGMQE